MTTLKIGSMIRHDSRNSSRFGSIGVVMDAPLLEGAGKAKYVVCWFSGPTVLPGHTTMALYTSNWLESNCVVLATPRDDNDESHAAKVYFSEKGKEMRKAAAAPERGPFMVCVEGASAPKKEHGSLALAKVEAERLSNGNPGRKVRILAVVNAVKTVTSTTVTWDK